MLPRLQVGYSNGTWAVSVPYTIDTAAGTVTLSPPPAQLQGSGGAAAGVAAEVTVTVTEVRYAWLGYPQCVLYSGQCPLRCRVTNVQWALGCFYSVDIGGSHAISDPCHSATGAC